MTIAATGAMTAATGTTTITKTGLRPPPLTPLTPEVPLPQAFFARLATLIRVFRHRRDLTTEGHGSPLRVDTDKKEKKGVIHRCTQIDTDVSGHLIRAKRFKLKRRKPSSLP